MEREEGVQWCIGRRGPTGFYERGGVANVEWDEGIDSSARYHAKPLS